MGVVLVLLKILSFFLSVVLIILVLLQRGRGGGLAGAFGGMGGQSAFGTKAGDIFTRITIVVAVIWVLAAGYTGVLARSPSTQNEKADANLPSGPSDSDTKSLDDLEKGDATGKAPAGDAESSSSALPPASGEKSSATEGTSNPAPAAGKSAIETPPPAGAEATGKDAVTPPAAEGAPVETPAKSSNDTAAPANGPAAPETSETK